MRLIPRLIRPVPEPLGLYVRPSAVDHRFLTDFLAETAPAGLRGVVFDARLDALQGDLRSEAQARGLESVIDLRARSRKRAGPFFEKRLAQSYYACKNDTCCKRGMQDMFADPRRHYLRTRLDEIARLSALPESMRPEGYLDQFLRPATDLLVKAASAEPTLQKTRSRLDSWRTSLSGLLIEGRPLTFSPVPAGRRVLLRRGA